MNPDDVTGGCAPSKSKKGKRKRTTVEIVTLPLFYDEVTIDFNIYNTLHVLLLYLQLLHRRGRSGLDCQCLLGHECESEVVE